MKKRKLILPLLCLFLFACSPATATVNDGGDGQDSGVIDHGTDEGDKDEKKDEDIVNINVFGPTKTTYNLNEQLDTTGLRVVASYKDNSTAMIDLSKVTITGFDSSRASNNLSVTVSYLTHSASFTVKIIDNTTPTLLSISVNSPTKASYYVGDALDTTGLVVTAHFSNNTSATISISEVTITGFNSSVAASNQVVTVTYQNKTATFTVSITNRQVTLSSISIKSPTKTTYYVGEELDLTGMVITAHYSDNSTSTIANNLASVTGFNSSSVISNQVVTISYQSKTATFTVSIIEKPVTYLNPQNEPYLGRQYYLNNIGDIYTVWEKYRGKGITIAVIDYGFDAYHEDFTYSNGQSKVSSKSAAFANGQKVQGVSGAAAANVSSSNPDGTDYSHGTFCAGVAAAGSNNKGVIGIAPEAELMLLKVDGKPTSINAAFKYAADNGAKIVTISLGSYYSYVGDLVNDGSDLGTIFNISVEYCKNNGVVVCSAAGNGGEDGQPTEYTFPGATPGIIGVGGLAANQSSEVWSGSSYNSSSAYQFADVFAPAESLFNCCNYSNVKYDGGPGWKGTSFASPIVAGMAALYFEKYPSKTVSQFEQALYNCCYAIDSSGHYGYGRVDVARLLDEKYSGQITVKFKSDWDNAYVYSWDNAHSKENASFPGVLMSKSGNTFTATINASSYECLLFSNGLSGKSEKKTPNLLASSFLNNHTYSILNPNMDDGLYIGTYQ